MPVYRDKKRGTWYVSYSFKDLPTGSFKHKTKRGFKTAKDAKEWERQNYGADQSRKPKTFQELVGEWEDNNQASSTSRRHHEESLKYRITDTFEKPVNDISKQDLIHWRNELIKMDYSTKTKNDTITLVRGVLAFGSAIYDLPNNYLILKSIKKTDEEVMKEMQIWSPEEFETFIQCIKDETYRTFFEFLFWTGCRRGEAIALQRSDVHGNKVYVRYSQRNHTTGLQPTKTKAKRWVAMDENLSKDVHHLMEETQGDYVFTTKNHEALTPTPIDNAFKKGIEESGVKPIRIHDLRHSHASWLINNGVNIVAVSKRLGHSSVEQTLKTYTHLLEATDNSMLDILNAEHERFLSHVCPTE